jgi:hypothetical protein
VITMDASTSNQVMLKKNPSNENFVRDKDEKKVISAIGRIKIFAGPCSRTAEFD